MTPRDHVEPLADPRRAILDRLFRGCVIGAATCGLLAAGHAILCLIGWWTPAGVAW